MSLTEDLKRLTSDWDDHKRLHTCAWCFRSLSAANDHIITYGSGLSMHHSCSMMYDQGIANEQFGKTLNADQ